MELIQKNPYRIIGILSNASERELQKQKAKITAYAKVGKEIKLEDFDFLGDISRTEDSVNKAFSNIEQNQDKVKYSLFWFLNANPFDNVAIEQLKNGYEEKAVGIWEKVTKDKDVSFNNFSSFNNLGTYKLLSRNNLDIKIGIEAKIKLIESEYFEHFVHIVANETYSIDNQEQSEKLIDELLAQFKNQYSISETLQLFSGCSLTTKKHVSKKFTEKSLHKIENQLESCKRKRKINKREAYKVGLDLLKNIKNDLLLLKSLLRSDALRYKVVADQLANEIMQCGIDYFNESQENGSSEHYHKQTQKLINIAKSIAVGKLTKDRAKDSLATLEEMQDQELNQAIQVLKSIRDAYESNEKTIRRQVRELEKNDAEIIMGLKSINQSAVEDNIRNSINWEKAVDMIQNIIPIENISKIKNAQNTAKASEYKELVEFVFQKLNYSLKNKIRYLQYWKKSNSKPSLSLEDEYVFLGTLDKNSSEMNTTSSESDTNKSFLAKNLGCLIKLAIFALVLWAISNM